MNSYIYEFKDLPSTDIPYNAETFNAMQNKLLDSIYPIGSIMIKDDTTDYSSYLGFSWEKVFAGVTLVGLDTTQTEFDTIGKIGGEKTHILTLNELPSNVIQTASSGNNSDGFIGRAGYDSNGTYNFGGQNLAHNNLPPYQVVAYWKRVA